MEKLAFNIDEAVSQSGLGRDSLYAAIKDGKLLARKAGRRTIVLAPDLAAYLRSLPDWAPSPVPANEKRNSA